jgi:hypothetical protein
MAQPTLLDQTPEVIQSRLAPRTIELLRTTREPRHAYICLEIPKVLRSDGPPEITTGLAFLNVEDQPAQLYNLVDLTRSRNAKLCCYGNFPTHNHPQPDRVSKWKLYNEPNGVNPWDNMAEACDQLMNRTTETAREIEAQTSKYKEELAKAQAELDKLKKESKK